MSNYYSPFCLSDGSDGLTSRVNRDFDSALPSFWYREFARRAGCLQDDKDSYSPGRDEVFQCLQSADTHVLQQANANVTADARYGQWAFIPVTDGRLLKARPTEQLRRGKVNGERILVGVCRSC